MHDLNSCIENFTHTHTFSIYRLKMTLSIIYELNILKHKSIVYSLFTKQIVSQTHYNIIIITMFIYLVILNVALTATTFYIQFKLRRRIF